MLLLDVHDLWVSRGSVPVLRGISLHVAQGEIVTLIGANGAGKSTTLRTISGLLGASRGQVKFADTEIQGTPPHRIARSGIVHVPEGRGIFPSLSVEENLMLGAYCRSDRPAIADDRRRVLDLFPRIRERLRQKAGTLSGGEQQMLALGRALLAAPRLLMLDEPSLGLSPQVAGTIFDVIRTVNQQGTTILLVEQNATMALELAHRAYVLELGSIQTEGPARQLAATDAVRKAFLGIP